MSLINHMLSSEELTVTEIAWYPTVDACGQPSAVTAHRVSHRWHAAQYLILPSNAPLFGSSEAARRYASKYLVTKINQKVTVAS